MTLYTWRIPGILYCLPKADKPNCPLRLILSAINTPSYKLVKYLISLLEMLSENMYTTKDRFL